MRLLPSGAVAAFIAAALTAGLPTTSHGQVWEVGLAGGYGGRLRVAATKYEWNQQTYDVRAPGTAIASLQLLRTLGQHFSLAGQMAYLPYGEETDNNYARHVPIAVGARYTPVSDPDRRGVPYFELSPALVWTHWRTFDYGDAERNSLRPGLIAGIGLHGKLTDKVSMDLGLRYFLSSDVKGQDRYPVAAETLTGMRQGAILLGLYYTL